MPSMRNVLIQFLTLRKLCSFVRSNSNRKPIASLKKAVVRLLNLQEQKEIIPHQSHSNKEDLMMPEDPVCMRKNIPETSGEDHILAQC